VGGKGQIHGVAFAPLRGWCLGTRAGEHIAVEVESNHVSSCAYQRRRLSGDDSGAAGHIEYAFTGFQR
jgi:hypothetical protein